MEMPAATITSRWTHRVVSHARGAGIDPKATLAQLGIKDAVLDDPHGRVLFAQHAELVRNVIERLDDPGVGVDCSGAEPGDFGVLSLLAESCATLGDALGTIRRFNALANEASLMDFWSSGTASSFAMAIIAMEPRCRAPWPKPPWRFTCA